MGGALPTAIPTPVGRRLRSAGTVDPLTNSHSTLAPPRGRKPSDIRGLFAPFRERPSAAHPGQTAVRQVNRVAGFGRGFSGKRLATAPRVAVFATATYSFAGPRTIERGPQRRHRRILWPCFSGTGEEISAICGKMGTVRSVCNRHVTTSKLGERAVPTNARRPLPRKPAG